MALAPAVIDIEQLQGHPAVARLVGWNRGAVEGVAAAIGGGAWCDEVLEQFAWLERRYVQD